MHFSDNPNNFRNKKYMDCMEEEFKKMCRAYYRYISYRNKLLKELTTNEEQREKIKKVDQKMVEYIDRFYKRVHKEEFYMDLEIAKEHLEKLARFDDVIMTVSKKVYQEYKEEIENWENPKRKNIEDELFQAGKEAIDKTIKKRGFDYDIEKDDKLTFLLRQAMVKVLIDWGVIEK